MLDFILASLAAFFLARAWYVTSYTLRRKLTGCSASTFSGVVLRWLGRTSSDQLVVCSVLGAATGYWAVIDGIPTWLSVLGCIGGVMLLLQLTDRE